MPGGELWLVGEHRTSGERKYYLANLPADADQDNGRDDQGRAASANSLISSSRKSSASTTLKAAHGEVFIAPR